MTLPLLVAVIPLEGQALVLKQSIEHSPGEGTVASSPWSAKLIDFLSAIGAFGSNRANLECTFIAALFRERRTRSVDKIYQ